MIFEGGVKGQKKERGYEQQRGGRRRKVKKRKKAKGEERGPQSKQTIVIHDHEKRRT